MKSGISEIVHIVPLGQEFDRAVRPFDTASANRVYIIADSGRGEGEAAEKFASRVVRYLKRKHIPAEVINTDFSDMQKLMAIIAYLVRKEQQEGNTVYVNMSAGGPAGAAAATLAGMALHAEVYCVHADRYASDAEREQTGVSVCTANTVSILPDVDIRLPDKTELPVLEEMYYTDEHELSAGEISDVMDDGYEDDEENIGLMMLVCRDNDIITETERQELRKIQSRNLMKVSGMMKRMEEKGYVTKSKSGRKMMYRLTERGISALILSGHGK